MFNRRQFHAAIGGAMGSLVTARAVTSAEPQPNQPATKKRLAVVTTEWRYHSHAWHMAERFLVGYPVQGKWHDPGLEVVSAYVDQTPDNDLSAGRSQEFGFPIYPTIAAALRCGGKQLAVDAVLVIGEHGNYPRNEFGQKKYPRYEFFKQVVDVFREDGRVAPMFNDKHLSWKWDWAKEMVDTSHAMKIPYLAGSSLPVTWRMPDVDLPYGIDVREAMCLAMGGIDSYDFHALEVIQCMVERRRGGEQGVAWVEALRGDDFWQAMEVPQFDKGGWNPDLFAACLARSQTLAQPESFSHRKPTLREMRQWVKDPVAYRIGYRDGLKATMLLMNGLVGDFTFAADIAGRESPLSTLFYLPPVPNVTYSASLMHNAEQTFMTGQPPYPVERTLLTGGMVEAGCQSLTLGKRIETPYMAVPYEVTRSAKYARG